MQKYEFLEHAADVTFKANGRDLNQLFENVSEALESTIVFHCEVALEDSCPKKIDSDSCENLLCDWLAKLLITFEIGRFAVEKCFGRIVGLLLTADCLGERLEPNRHRLNTEVKR
ncbi:MAG TPA: archease [Candidatus Bathyarchaeia archaeon]|nr:archease [Candidatus Bathyarchaeia archaeon]